MIWRKTVQKVTCFGGKISASFFICFSRHDHGLRISIRTF